MSRLLTDQSQKEMNRLAFSAFAFCLAVDAFATGLSGTRPEIVTARFANAAEAEAAEIAIAPLPEGRRIAFTSRWDDSSAAHLKRAQMFRRTGVSPMFFLNGDVKYYKNTVPELMKLGARIGNHTVSHPFLMESSVNLMFNEVVENKLRVECFSDMPNTSFVIPYNWQCSLEPRRAAMLAKILVDNGIFVSSDWPLDAAGQPASEWMPGYTFSGNDNRPNDKEFYSGLSNAVAKAEKNLDYPKVTFGLHSWCNDEGLALQERWLKGIVREHDGDWWITDDAHYGAYRYEYWHAKTRKLGVRGKTAIFEVLRHDPAFLGEVQPLTYTFGKVKPIKVSSSGGYSTVPPLPAKIDRMQDGVSSKFPGLALKVAVNEAKGTLEYTFTGGAEVIAVVVNPAPMWSRGRILASESKKTVALGVANEIAEYREGDRLYVVGVDFVKDGVRGRLYATETVTGERKKFGGTARDTALVIGPIDSDGFTDEKIAAASKPGVTLPHVGKGIHQFWRSMADRNRCGFSAASYIPWSSSVSGEFKSALAKAEPADRPVFLVAVEFECAEAGEKDFLVNREIWQPATFWLNGIKIEKKGGRHRISVQSGLNRIVYRWEWFQPWIPQACLISVCDGEDVNRAVKFVPLPTESREGVFKSEGFCADFDQDGRFRTIEYAGRKPFTIDYECCASLKAKEDFTPQMAYENGPGRIVCTRNSELGAKSDDYSEKAVWTVTEDTVEFAGEVCVREGVKWNAYVACAILGFPIDFFAGRTLELTDAKGGVHRIDYPIEFNKSSCVIGIPFVALSNGEWKIELEDAQVGNFSDLRAWNSDYANLRLCPKDGLKWTGKVSDGGTYKWKWRITRLKK